MSSGECLENLKVQMCIKIHGIVKALYTTSPIQRLHFSDSSHAVANQASEKLICFRG